MHKIDSFFIPNYQSRIVHICRDYGTERNKFLLNREEKVTTITIKQNRSRIIVSVPNGRFGGKFQHGAKTLCPLSFTLTSERVNPMQFIYK